jgi:Tfp pilus assembly protein PilN
MLHTNLSTRPFYNARAVQTILGVLALIVLAVTLFNVAQIVRLTLQQRSLSARAVQAERDAQRLRSEAVVIRGRIDPKELTVVAGQAREANAIIDQRTFSWTELFETFEATLPADVRITAVKPRLEQDGTFYVGMTVEARRAEDVDAFVEALEKSNAFHDVLPNEEQLSEDGLLEAVIDGVYAAPSRTAAQPATVSPVGQQGGSR